MWRDKYFTRTGAGNIEMQTRAKNVDLLNWTRYTERKTTNTKKTCRLGFIHKKRKPGSQKLFLFFASLIKHCVLGYCTVLPASRVVVKNQRTFAKPKNRREIHRARSKTQIYKTLEWKCDFCEYHWRGRSRECRSLVLLRNCLCLDQSEERSRR